MQVSIRELKVNPARAIALMQQGNRVQITSHRKVVAELVKPNNPLEMVAAMTDEEAMQKLLASGLVAEQATRPFKLGKAITFPSSPDGKTMSDWVIELRGPK
jgi:antitoxin (DNA-binding transcriptional repressor) of toxin-antitoxin stability system